MSPAIPATTSTVTTSIDDLPPEMINELFKHLFSLQDLVACSQVNKRWHSIYSTFKMDVLAVSDYSGHQYLQMEERELWHPSVFRRWMCKPLLSDLKHLHLHEDSSPKPIDLNELNRFGQLLHLSINEFLEDDDHHEHSVNFHFPRLQFLEFDSRRKLVLSIDCPALRMLVLRDGREYEAYERLKLEVKHPETIKKLKTGMVDQQFVAFKSVECLVTREFKAVCKATIRLLPALKELHYEMDIGRTILWNDFKTQAGMRRALSEFLDDLETFKGRDIKFRFAGFPLIRKTLDEIDLGVPVKHEYREGIEDVCEEYVYMKNYHLIDPDATLDYIWRLDYPLLMRLVAGEIPSCFFKKFNHINSVAVLSSAIEDEEHLLWFIKSLRTVHCVDFSGAQLSQKFYDLLPEAAPYLALIEVEGEGELQLNFDFVGKCSHIGRFIIDQELSIESITALVSWLDRPSLQHIDLIFKGTHYYISKATEEENEEDEENSSTFYYVWNGESDEPLFATEFPEEIPAFFEQPAKRVSGWSSLTGLVQWVRNGVRSYFF